MRRATPFLVFLSLALGVGFSRAKENPKVDFDNAHEETGIVERAQKVGQTLAMRPLLRAVDAKPLPADLARYGVPKAVMDAIRAAASTSVGRQKEHLPLPDTVPCDNYPIDKDDPGGDTPSLCGAGIVSQANGKPGAAYVTGPYLPFVRDNPDYNKALALKSQLEGNGVRMRSLVPAAGPVPGSGPVLSAWPPIAARYQQYLDGTTTLDRDDDALGNFAVRLNTWAAKIEARRKELDSDAAVFHQYCKGTLPPDEFNQCNAYRDRYNECVVAHNNSIAQEQQLVKVWQDDKNCLQSRGDTFKSNFLDWIKSVVLPWISNAADVLEGNFDCKLGKPTLTQTQINPPIWALHCPYACKSYAGKCGIAKPFAGEAPNAGQIGDTCPLFANPKSAGGLVDCPATFPLREE